MEQTIEIAKEEFYGLCFVNLVDFDALWGHRRDPLGYARSLKLSGELLEANTFAVIGATIADNFRVNMPEGTIGYSLLSELV